jgi:hypothetical protein
LCSFNSSEALSSEAGNCDGVIAQDLLKEINEDCTAGTLERDA